MLRRWAAGLFLSLIALALNGCYTSTVPVIPPELAVAVPNLEGRYVGADGQDPTVLKITAIAGTNDYEATSEDPAEPSKLTLRAVALNDTTYLLQIWDAGVPDDGVLLAFIVAEAEGVSVKVPLDPVEALAKQHGVTLDADKVALTGDAAAQFAFLQAHASLNFMDKQPFLKRVP